jgi:hypothetical protein
MRQIAFRFRQINSVAGKTIAICTAIITNTTPFAE